MPLRDTQKQAKSKSRSKTKATKPIAQAAAKQCTTNKQQPSAPALQRGTRGGLRSTPALLSAAPFIEDPESILRNRRKLQQPSSALLENPPLALTRENLNKLAKAVEVESEDESIEIEDGITSDEETSGRTHDSQQSFFQQRGYLPPLEKKISTLLKLMAASPDVAASLAQKALRRSPGKADFGLGLDARNTPREECEDDDLYQASIMSISAFRKSLLETRDQTTCFDMLWDYDHAKCDKLANEALFQRTLMISLIARHCLIYKSGAKRHQVLDFSVEEPWKCPPMPTRDFVNNLGFLTSPVPDLAVGFCRNIVLPSGVWPSCPKSIRQIICYENLQDSGQYIAFHFFTIEAKNSLLPPENLMGLHQSLNNASQALHNMFKFFQDAGQEEVFFEKVRFFSAVASNLGILIRIHRAIKLPEAHIARIVPDYPLQFEYRKFAKLGKDSNFDRGNVLKNFERILHGYGEEQLLPLLQNAARTLWEKFTNDTKQLRLRSDENFYLHGQGRQKAKRDGFSSRVGASIEPPTDIMSFDPPRSKVLSRVDQLMRDASPTPMASHGAIGQQDVIHDGDQIPNGSKADEPESLTDARFSAAQGRPERPHLPLSRGSTHSDHQPTTI